MGNPLRDRRSPSELAESEQVIEINEKIADFGRLAGIVEADLASLDPDKLPQGWRDSPVTGRLEFGFDDAQARRPVLEGEVAVTVDAVCQRCLEPFRLGLSCEFSHWLAADPVRSDERSGFEIWELDDDTVRPSEIVEEALIMAMPLSAVHESSDECPEPVAGEERTTRPFAKLRDRLQNEKQ